MGIDGSLCKDVKRSSAFGHNFPKRWQRRFPSANWGFYWALRNYLRSLITEDLIQKSNYSSAGATNSNRNLALDYAKLSKCKSLTVAWTPKLLKPKKKSWKTQKYNSWVWAAFNFVCCADLEEKRSKRCILHLKTFFNTRQGCRNSCSLVAMAYLLPNLFLEDSLIQRWLLRNVNMVDIGQQSKLLQNESNREWIKWIQITGWWVDFGRLVPSD